MLDSVRRGIMRPSLSYFMACPGRAAPGAGGLQSDVGPTDPHQRSTGTRARSRRAIGSSITPKRVVVVVVALMTVTAPPAFLSDHRHFDIAEFVASLGWPVPGRTYAPGPVYRDALLPFRAVIDEMTAVFERLASGPKAQAGYDDHRIAEMLADARR